MKKALIGTELSGVDLFKRGKVRDVYRIADKLLVIATDRISAFDVVLSPGIPGKGEVLTRMAAFWFAKMERITPHHLLSTDMKDLPRAVASAHPELEGRFMLVRKAESVPVECVVRGYITGSAWKDYRKTGEVCGMKLAPGLVESAKFAEPIFTPTTKAEQGHDENMTRQQLVDLVGAQTAAELEEKTIRLYEEAARYALTRGIIIADTKIEWGRVDGRLIAIDEIFTPDSSRFWPAGEYAPGRPQPSFDKQFVRDWLETTTWDKKPPAPELPGDVVEKTAQKYREAMRMLTAV